jgi:hypothetical protein
MDCVNGNGGMSSWTKTYVANMKTHENQKDGDITRIADFCMDSKDNYTGQCMIAIHTISPIISSFGVLGFVRE